MEGKLFHRLVLLGVLIIYGLLLKPEHAYAQVNEAGNSAKIATRESDLTPAQSTPSIIKKMAISRVLARYRSPYTASASAFVEACVKHNIDCYMLPAISGVESYFGKFTYPNSNNPFGWGGGLIMFTSWDNGIDTVAAGLSKNYVQKGRETIQEIAPIYCPPSTTWSGKVEFFYKQFVLEEQKLTKLNNI